jgi:hypothetical protein
LPAVKRQSQSEYALKLAAYRQSGFQITKSVAEHYETWDERKVEARQQKLAAVACSIWKSEI